MKSAHTKCGVGRIRCFARCFSNSGERRKWRSVRSISGQCECRWVLGIWKTTCRRRPYESSESPSSSSSSSSRSCATMNRPVGRRRGTQRTSSAAREAAQLLQERLALGLGGRLGVEGAGRREETNDASARNCAARARPSRHRKFAGSLAASSSRLVGHELRWRLGGRAARRAASPPCRIDVTPSRPRGIPAAGAVRDGAHSERQLFADGVDVNWARSRHHAQYSAQRRVGCRGNAATGRSAARASGELHRQAQCEQICAVHLGGARPIPRSRHAMLRLRDVIDAKTRETASRARGPNAAQRRFSAVDTVERHHMARVPPCRPGGRTQGPPSYRARTSICATTSKCRRCCTGPSCSATSRWCESSARRACRPSMANDAAERPIDLALPDSRIADMLSEYFAGNKGSSWSSSDWPTDRVIF